MTPEDMVPEMGVTPKLPKGVPKRPVDPGSIERKYSRRQDTAPEMKYSFETPPDPIPLSSIKETVTADVVVVGGGVSGMSAALSAVEGGARVILIEKAKSCQGFGAANAAIGSRLQKKLGINIDKEEVILNLMKYAANRPNQKLIRMWAYGSGETMDWLMDMTDAAGLEATLPDFPPPAAFSNANEYYPKYITAHFFGGQKLVVKCIMNNALKKGVVMYFNTRSRQLLREGKNSVTGVIAQDAEGNYIQYNAKKAVVLCTGDYGNNTEMVAKYCPEVLEFGTSLRTATGDGHQMAMWVGATMEPVPHAPMIHISMGPLDASPFLQVNINGERFHNEDVPMELVATAVLRQPGKIAWQVFDSKYPEEVQYMGMGLGIVNKIDDMTRGNVERKSVFANTLEELAKKMEVPSETFKATVARYNELAHLGKDLDFGKRADRLTAIDHPPYYSGKGFIWFMCIVSGLNVNTRLQPLDKDGEAIPGLYLAGNIVGNRFGVGYPSMCSGLSNGMALHFGRVAGMNATA